MSFVFSNVFDRSGDIDNFMMVVITTADWKFDGLGF